MLRKITKKLLFLIIHILGVAGINYRNRIAIYRVSKIPFLCISYMRELSSVCINSFDILFNCMIELFDSNNILMPEIVPLFPITCGLHTSYIQKIYRKPFIYSTLQCLLSTKTCLQLHTSYIH